MCHKSWNPTWKRKNSQSLSRLWVQYSSFTGHASSRWPSNNTGSNLQYLFNTLNVTYVHPFPIPAFPALRIARGCWSQSQHVIGWEVGSYKTEGNYPRQVKPNSPHMHVYGPSRPSKAFAPASYLLLIYVPEELMALHPQQPSLNMSAIKTWKRSNAESDRRMLLLVVVLAAPVVLHEKRHASAEYLGMCCNLPQASALSSYLRVLCNCSGARDPKPGRNICMLTFIILFCLYGGLPRSVNRQRTQRKKKLFFRLNQLLSTQKDIFPWCFCVLLKAQFTWQRMREILLRFARTHRNCVLNDYFKYSLLKCNRHAEF